MAKLKHPATLIKNGRVIARGVSFIAALKAAGAADIKGAARRRVNFYKGKPFYFSPDNQDWFAIVPTQNISYTDRKQTESVWEWYDRFTWHLNQEAKFASWGQASLPCNYALTQIVSLVLRGAIIIARSLRWGIATFGAR